MTQPCELLNIRTEESSFGPGRNNFATESPMVPLRQSNELSDYYRVTDEGRGSPKLLPKQYYKPLEESKSSPKAVPRVVASLEMAKDIFKPEPNKAEDK